MAVYPDLKPYNGSMDIKIFVSIYIIILLKAVCVSLFANYRLQFLLDRLGRYFKLFVSTVISFSHAFASQFGLANLASSEKPQKPSVQLIASCTSKRRQLRS